MNKKIIISLSVIAVVAAVVVGGTIAYFSDTETSTGNTFTAGTIDISVNGENPWSESFTLADMKPCYTDYINFRIENDLSDPNPVNIFKKITVTNEGTGVVSEPECDDQGGLWDKSTKACDWNTTSATDNNDLSSMIWYDLNVEVYNSLEQKIWWQTLYVDGDNKSIDDVYGTDSVKNQVFLGMIPAGGYMLVEQSYHLRPDADNAFQGDVMTFDIEVKGVQLYGTAWLENKEGAEPWKIIYDDEIKGTLTYKVKHPTFDFSFTGRAPLASRGYVLAAGYDAGSNVDTYLGQGMTDTNGDITITNEIELGKDMKDVKVWLVPLSDWDVSAQQVIWPSPWTASYGTFLWETGLIWYEDTDF